MARGSVIQTDFSAGVLDPRMASRIDLEVYQRGATELTNVQALQQGGVKRRPGTRFINELNGPGRIASFEFSTEQNYVVVFSWEATAGGPRNVAVAGEPYLHIFRAKTQGSSGASYAFIETIQMGSPDDDDVPWTQAQLDEINWTQSLDTMIIVQRDHRPMQLKRTTGEGGSGPFFALTQLTDLTNIPSYDFGDPYSPPASGANEEQMMLFENDWTQGKHHNFGLKLYAETTGWIHFYEPTGAGTEASPYNFDEFAADVLRVVERDLKQLKGDVAVRWALPPSATPNGYVEIYIQFVGQNGGRDWPLLRVEEGGNVGAYSISEYKKGGVAYEPVWSSKYDENSSIESERNQIPGRGWPSSVTFHGSRLWFGGSKDRPSTLWGSNIGLFFDFDLGTGEADAAISVTIASDQVDAIRHIYSSRYLEIFTSGAEYYIKATPITPETIEIPRQTRYGTASALRPLNLDGATLFMDGQGRGLRQFLFSYTEEAYQSADLSVFSASLINDPKDLAAQHGVDADYGYVVNGDGTIAVMCTNRFQGVTTWTKYETRAGDKFLQAESVGNELFVITRRSINGADRYYLEKLDEAYFTDCGYRFIKTTATGTWNSDDELWHLIGEDCEVRSEGPDTEPATVSAAFDDVTVPFTTVAGVEVSSSFNSKSGTTDMDSLNLEVGFGFDVAITPMTPGLSMGGVVNVSRTRRICQVTLDLLTSKDVYVDGWRVADHFAGGGTGYDPLTGVFDVRILGYSRRPVVRITQESPLEFTLLGVEMEVAV